MADVSNRTVSIYIDQSAAELALTKLQQKADKLRQSITQGEQAGKNMSRAMAELGKTQTQIDQVTNAINSGLRPSLQQQTTLVNQLRNELRRMSEDMPGFKDKIAQFRNATAELDRMRTGIDGVATSQQSMLSKAGAFVASLGAGLAMQALGAIKEGLASVFKMNSQFESSLANLSSITGATGKDLDFLKNAAIDLSKQGKQSAVDYVEAFKLIASAKPELLEQKESLVEVTKAAKLLSDAAGLELPDAATRLTDALNQFGAPAQDAGKYVDTLAAAAKYGAAEVPEVTEALLKFGAQAKSSNISIGESSAAIELLAEKGIKGAEAGTQLRNVFLALNAVDALPKTGIEALAQAGVNTDILKNKSLSLEDRLKELSKISGNATALVQVFGKENFNAAQILLQGLPRYSELTQQIKEQGVAQQQATINTNTLSNAWERFKNVLAANFLNGDNSFLKGLVNDMTALVEPTKTATQEFGDLSKQVQHLDKDILPLANRYDELKGKTNLNNKEQAELKSIISQISAVIPSAVTQFDSYGNAISISSTRVRQFIEDQKTLLQVTNKAAIEDTKKKMVEAANQIEILGVKLREAGRNGFIDVLERDETQFGAPLKINHSTDQKDFDKVRAALQEQQQLSRAYYLQLMQLNGTALEDQINASQKAVENSTKKTDDIIDDAINKTDKKKDNALKNFQEFIKGIDEAIVNNQIPEHTKPLIEALRRMADETEKLNDIAKLDKKGKPTNITAEQYAEGGKKILQEYKTWLQKFVEEESKNFKAPVNASTIADGLITPTADKPKIDLPLNINTDVTPEEEKALKEKLAKLSEKLKEQADLDKHEQEVKEANRQVIDAFLQDAQTAISVIDKLGQARASNEQRALQQELKANDTKKAAFQRQLNQRVISQQEYQIQVSKLDSEAAKKQDDLSRLQFERSKKLQIAQAIANGAMAVTSTLAARPGAADIISLGAFRAIQIGMAVATTAVEVAAIAKQKYAAGGKVEKLSDGKITAGQNVPTQSNGDNVLAYVKQGEVILNEQQQAALGGAETFRKIGVPGFANGGVIRPAYQTRSYQAINFEAATRSIVTTRQFATGGLVTGNNNSQPTAADPALLVLLQSNQAAIEDLTNNVAVLQDRLSKPITATTNILLSKIEDATEQKNRILSEATFK
jgi:TP901 family phage tail tape measure protein